MKIAIRTGLIGLALAAAATASGAQAGGMAICLGSTTATDGLTDFSAYTIARSETDVSRSALQREAEERFRASNPPNQRVRCRGHIGDAHFVIVRAAQALNGRTIQLLGFGFGDSRAEALEASRRQLSDYADYDMFLGRGGQLEVVEEGTIAEGSIEG